MVIFLLHAFMREQLLRDFSGRGGAGYGDPVTYYKHTVITSADPRGRSEYGSLVAGMPSPPGS